MQVPRRTLGVCVYEAGRPLIGPEFDLMTGAIAKHTLLLHNHNMARQPLSLALLGFGLSSPK